jgi:hypothetical protein
MLPLLPDHGHDVSHIPGAANERHEHPELARQLVKLEERVREVEQLAADLRERVQALVEE